MSAMATPFKNPKTGIYYFRMAVPKQLIPMLGKREFKHSLRTKDLREAKQRFASHLQDALDSIELARIKLSESVEVELTSKDCAIIAERWFNHVRDHLSATGDYSQFLNVGLDDKQRKVEIYLSDCLQFNAKDSTQVTTEELAQLADELKHFITEQLEREGLTVSPLSDSFRRLGVSFYRYLYRIEALCRAFSRDDYGFNPILKPIAKDHLSVESAQPKQKEITPTNTISKLFERYLKTESLKDRDGKTLNETTLQIDRLIEVLGDLDVTTLKRSHMVEFRDTLLQLPKTKSNEVRSLSLVEQIKLVEAQGLPTISATTVKNCMRKVSAVLSYAVELGWIEVNPVSGVKVDIAKKMLEVEDANGYTESEVTQIFAHSVFKDVEAPKPYGMACYWLPLLCRYTGARVEEMAQLHRSDISCDNGVHYINVRRGEGQSVKNNASLRHIPIHSHLIDLGFLEYVNASQGVLFPELNANKYGKRSVAYSKWWGTVVRGLGIQTNKPSHAFRHTFKTLLRTLEIPDTTSDAITGHKADNVGGTYGTVTLDTKKAAIERIPRLKIDKLDASM